MPFPSVVAASWWQVIAVPAAEVLVGAVVLGLLVYFGSHSRRWWRKRYREPFHEGILRPPGWGCLERREDALMETTGLAVGMMILAMLLPFVVFTGKPFAWVGVVLAGVPTGWFGFRRIRKLIGRARTERLGFLGECVVAEALAPLAAKGWRVFHDLPMEVDGKPFNIDHVAVGPGGVWAIETKSFSKSKLVEKGGDSLRVEGEVVVLPDGRRSQALKQARGAARALQVRCNGAEAPVKFVEPLVVLPGWTVNYPKGAAPQIRDPRNVVAFLEGRERVMDDAAVEKVAAKLEEWCRVLRFEAKDAG
ncbi:nuclease-related domain-containing protein [Haloferula sp. A504]|uniref:nuclease-related domain-containing protein n=1 Tax=Haloferula sp. A504 TaxID=3373601 RepID=UPI0031C9407B|nr:NERD domain-containing protein [Verrucomicrobiaceae bacterium E54]